MRKKPIVLCVLDGWGIPKSTKYCAITRANTPNFDDILENYPNCKLNAAEEYVGLPKGQMGNSEVGHMNIGAGRIIFQDLPKINNAIKKDLLRNKSAVKNTLAHLKKSNGTLHLMGLLSDGGVHSHQDHIVAVAKIFASENIDVCIHCFLDGRDTPQKSASIYLKRFREDTKDYPNIKIATVSGRYYAMDRDNRWDRVEKAYDVIVLGESIKSDFDALSIVKKSYKNDKTDEFVEPMAVKGYKGVKNGDGLIFANFRADRARQITMALVNPNFSEFKRKKTVKFTYKVQMTEYSAKHNDYMDTIFPPEKIRNSLGEVLSRKKFKQLRIAETEKYAHVTFFFSGGREEKFEGEERILVDSPKVATYDLKPEMSAKEVKDKLIAEIKADKFDFIIINFANPDMIGHTGIMEAAIKACVAVDKCLGEVVDAVLKEDGVLMVTADHGNIEKMFDEVKSQPHTAHTTNQVPFILVGNDVKKYKLKDGNLCSIAPTVLELMEIEKPKEMECESMITG